MLYNRLRKLSPGVVVETASAFTVTSQKHAGKITSLQRAAGQAVTLPRATGSGDSYTFFVATAITSNTTTIKVPDANHTMAGNALALADGGDTMVGFEAGAAADTVTMDGSTQGGLKGHLVTLTDVGTNLYMVESVGAATGSEASPFSATVS